ncbi:MAG: hypothetical protein ACYTG0_26200 [Planctomycetota bacterium]|jgi:hypothetical protein
MARDSGQSGSFSFVAWTAALGLWLIALILINKAWIVHLPPLGRKAFGVLALISIGAFAHRAGLLFFASVTFVAWPVDRLMSNSEARIPIDGSAPRVHLTRDRRSFIILARAVISQLYRRVVIVAIVCSLAPFIAAALVDSLLNDETITGWTLMMTLLLWFHIFFVLHRILLIRLCRKHGLVCPSCHCTPMKRLVFFGSAKDVLALRRCERCRNELFPRRHG